MNNLQNVTYLRCFAVISLVAWHSYCSYICWGIADTPVNGVYTAIFKFIAPDANMPLFTLLAGYLFCFLFNEKGKYQEYYPFLKNKTNRLLIPFLVLGSLTNLTSYGKDITDLFYGLPNHLWYCLMLFYCYLACWIIEKNLGQKWNILATIISFLVVCWRGGGAIGIYVPFGLFLPLYYYCYFYVGYLIFQYREWIANKVKQCWIFVVLTYIVCAFKAGHLLFFASVSFFLLLLLMIENLSKLTKFTPPSRY